MDLKSQESMSLFKRKLLRWILTNNCTRRTIIRFHHELYQRLGEPPVRIFIKVTKLYWLRELLLDGWTARCPQEDPDKDERAELPRMHITKIRKTGKYTLQIVCESQKLQEFKAHFGL